MLQETELVLLRHVPANNPTTGSGEKAAAHVTGSSVVLLAKTLDEFWSGVMHHLPLSSIIRPMNLVNRNFILPYRSMF